MRYEHIARAVYERPWFLEERTFSTMTRLLGQRLAGDRLDDTEIRARLEAAAAANGPRAGGSGEGTAIALIPVYGVIMQRAGLMTEVSGGTSVQGITRAMRRAMDDPDVGAILLEFDSPGGEVSGIEELATEIREFRAQARKPIGAISNTMMASAAYYLGSQADEVVATPSSLTGSIGVVFAHTEISKAAEAEGITTTIVRQPARKAEVNEWEALTDDARAHLQEEVDDYYGQFVAAVAKGRGVTQAAVRDGYGQGTVLTAKRALAAGLVDRVDTLEGTLGRLAGGTVVMRGAKARLAADIQKIAHEREANDWIAIAERTGAWAETHTAAAFGMPLEQWQAVAQLGLTDEQIHGLTFTHPATSEPDRSAEREAAVALARARR